jgi:hypothetical protein
VAPGKSSQPLGRIGWLIRRSCPGKRALARAWPSSPPPGPWRESGRAIPAWRRPRPSRYRVPRRPGCRAGHPARGCARALKAQASGVTPWSERRSARPGAKGVAARGAPVRHPVVRPSHPFQSRDRHRSRGRSASRAFPFGAAQTACLTTRADPAARPIPHAVSSPPYASAPRETWPGSLALP